MPMLAFPFPTPYSVVIKQGDKHENKEDIITIIYRLIVGSYS